MLRKPASQAAAELNIDNESNAGEQLDEEEEVVGPGLVQLNIDPTDSSSQKNTGHDGGWKKAGREENKGKARRRYSVATYGKSEAQTRRIEADRRRLDAQRAQLRAHGMAVGRGEFAFGAGAAAAADPVPAHLNLLLELVLQQGLPVRKHPRGFPHRPLPRVLMLVANPPRVVCCRPGHALRGNYKKGIDICAIERILVGQVDRYPDTEVFRRVGRGGGGKAARGGGPACCLSLVATPPPPPPEEEAPAGAEGGRKNKRQASHGSVVDKIRPSLDIEVDTPEDCIELANALALYIQKLRPDIRNAIELPARRRSLAERVAADAVAGRRGSTSSAGGGGGRGRRTLRLLLGRSGASDTSRKREESESQVSTVSGLLPGSANENEKQLASGSKTPEIQI